MNQSPSPAGSPGLGPQNAPSSPDLSGTQEADMKHAARSGGMQVLTVIAQGIGPLMQVLFARLFGATVFGAYQSSTALLEVIVRGGTAGADKAMLRYVAGARAHGDEAGVDSALHTGLRQALLLAVPLAAALMLGAEVIARRLGQPSIGTSLPIMAPAIALTGTTFVLIQATLGAKQTRPNFIVRGLCEPLFLLIAGLVAAGMGRDLRHLAWGHLTASAATCALALFVAASTFGPRSWARVWRARSVPGFFAFSLPLGLSEFANAVLQRADILMLTAYAGARSAGIYAAAEFLGRIVANVRYAFDSVAASVLSEALHLSDHDRIQYNLKLMTRWVVSVAAPLAAITIALRADLLLLFGPDFALGSTAMVVLAIGHLVNASNLGPWLLVVSGRSLLMFLGNLGCAVLNIVLGLLLIPRYGIVGTACAVTSSIVVLHLFLGLAVWRLQRVHPFDSRTIKPILAAAAMLAVELALRSALEQHRALAIPATVIAGGAVYLAVLGMLGLPQEERRILNKITARFGAGHQKR